ncbi:hypothetical protein AB0D32_24065 [Micromonospora sp. NPDC048170]|uniref:hypothetical protein n=1 Tax=Micromonospora sp. NPDC048170 TaxID=3154819 RepID=UPI0033DFB123
MSPVPSDSVAIPAGVILATPHSQPEGGLKHIRVRARPGQYDVVFLPPTEDQAPGHATARTLFEWTLRASPLRRGWSVTARHSWRTDTTSEE